jgi:predicted CoA-substrate-specific enzyme activase
MTTMGRRKNYLGIDIGSVSMSVAVLDEHHHVIHTAYVFHKGQIAEKIESLLQEIDLSQVSNMGYTSSAPAIFKQGCVCDSRVSYITAAKHLHPDLSALLMIGAEKFGLVNFDKNGEYVSYKSNTSCAAGTGNFLDQQAERLNLKSIEAFSNIAWQNEEPFPQIASRCAVFAKTDLIHAQQEGYSLAAICDGLTYGLAKNIVDAIFQNNSFSTLVAAGGVALNKAVIRHIEKLVNTKITVDEFAHVYSAIGAALESSENKAADDFKAETTADILIHEKKEIKYFYPPLKLELSDYPDFGSLEEYEFVSMVFPEMKAVEVNIYKKPDPSGSVFIGIDIGSTSTKALLLSHDKSVIAGLYTRTSGQPLQAVQIIFEAIRDIEHSKGIQFTILSAGTTGSGRKFIGKIIGADVIPDEITAHARAAYELDPETDTIIEIGGQDSKFTTMHDGMVTFSVMNNVCAAGTGSFIEEQAKRLGVPLSQYSSRAENIPAPLTSDRCTVFMERDLNHYLNEGFSVDEILAAVLHSTRENYLTKVAVTGSIGKKIFFQGATAKNKALVAAFEQKLKKPVMVSKYCHLTGALGTALELSDKNIQKTKFRGLDLYKKEIPIRSETCDLCNNNCKLKIAEIDGETEAYGFLCGRDYHTNKFVKNTRNSFQLIAKRNEIYRFHSHATKTSKTVGIPAGLHMFEEIPFWRKFFDLLSIKTVTSEDYKTVVKDGKNLCSAEFCAPVAAMHGHVSYLLKMADFVFLPVYLENDEEAKENKQYCYYTQFVSSVISVQKHFQPKEKLLMPILRSSKGEIFVRFELLRMLRSMGLNDISLVQVTMAYYKAQKYNLSLTKKWRLVYEKEIKDKNDIHIVILGRPYTVLLPSMNNHIPEIIEKNGISPFFMDMLPLKQKEISKADELIKNIKWIFASKILYAAELIAKTDNCYPLLVTSFKCTPDSFVIEYFKEILNSYKKPYLILQLDEHDSAVGYETRIESGIRAFRNHHQKRKPKKALITPEINDRPETLEEPRPLDKSWEKYLRSLAKESSRILKVNAIDFKLFSRNLQSIEAPGKDFSYPMIRKTAELKDKTLLLPSWDAFVGPLLEAVLQNCGVDARLVNSSQESMQRSLSYNTGQCLPLNICVQDSIDFIEKNKLNPANTVLWNIKSNLSCNLSMFPQYTKKLLCDYGKGMEKVSVYLGDVVFYDFSLQTAINAYLAYMFGGSIRKIACMIRPYEKEKGVTEKVVEWAMAMLYDVFRLGQDKEKAIKKIILAFEAIPVVKKRRPKVAIFGDLYVRDNDMMNQNLIRVIEENGGEAITTSYSEYLKIIIEPITERLYQEGRYLEYAKHLFLKSICPLVENKFNKYFFRILPDTKILKNQNVDEWLNRFGLNLLHRGESFENILKIYNLVQNYPDLDLFVQTNPSYCCPSLVTEAMTTRIEEMTGVPVVTIEYDGTSASKNDIIIPYLKYRKKKKN